MVAAKHGHVAVVELLLLAGADYFLRNKVRDASRCRSWYWFVMWLVVPQKGKRARDLATQPAVRALCKSFDLSLAAARNYSKHHADRLTASVGEHHAGDHSNGQVASVQGPGGAQAPASGPVAVAPLTALSNGAAHNAQHHHSHGPVTMAPVTTGAAGAAAGRSPPSLAFSQDTPVPTWSPHSPSRPSAASAQRSALLSPLTSLNASSSLSGALHSPTPEKPPKRNKQRLLAKQGPHCLQLRAFVAVCNDC
jgi:hypothetical protein